MSSGWNISGAKKVSDRRLSSSGQLTNSSVQPAAGACKVVGDLRRPLTAVLSEDASSKHHGSSTEPQVATPGIKQSFLSKLTTRSETKTTSSTLSEKNVQPPQLRKADDDATNNNLKAKSESGKLLLSSSSGSMIYGTECDRVLSDKPTNDLENRLIRLEEEEDGDVKNKRKAGGELMDKNKSSRRQENQEGKSGNEDENENVAGVANDQKVGEDKGGGDDDEDDDDDNQVIPSWPSRSDASRTRNSEFIQHKVYSLKDYSQVANPAAAAAPTNQTKPSTSSGNKLLKSMSQDRKVKANTKRLSECLYLSSTSPLVMGSILPGAGSGAESLLKGQNPSGPTQPGATTNYGLLSTPGHSVLLSESRIDRVRKLFVSPLSLKSHGGFNHTKSAAMRGAGHQRLSFQSGASSMLYKPQHLMHAMYRTSGGAHHGGGGGSGAGPTSRRSPLRQKQTKSFRVYGCPLQMANNIYPITCFGRADIYKQQSVPYILARLCNYIEENSSHLTHEGIFRVSGNARLMEKLRTLFDHLGDAPLESESVDVATSASMLKMYLRELPEPLIPTRMNYYFTTLAKKYSLYLASPNSITSSYQRHQQTNASSTSETPTTATTTTTDNSSSDAASQNARERQQLAFSRDLTKLVRKLPAENYDLLKYLACFLYRISLKQQYNKMCAEALGIVFGPNVFRIRNESFKGLKEQELSNQIMASIISNYKSIFDSEITDPLGNLVETNEDDELVKEKAPANVVSSSTDTTATNATTTNSVLLMSKGSSGDQQPGHIQSESILEDPTKANPLIDTTPMPSTSKVTCCPAYCLFDAASEGSPLANEPQLRVCDLVGDEVEDDEDDDDDDDCDEGESYTPSSNSDSYCSSIGSETIETSSCDGGAQHDNKDKYYSRDINTGARVTGDGILLDGIMSTHTSSDECASDTSYTPTSSHSDSDGMPDDEADEADESLYGNSSSFDSSLSLAVEEGQERRRRQPAPQVCRVCKRRESAHLDRIANGSLVARTCDQSPRLNPNEPDQKAISEQQAAEELAGGTSGQNSGRRRVDGHSRSPMAGQIEERPEECDEVGGVTMVCGDKADDQTDAHRVKETDSDVPMPSRLACGKKSDFLRRRSSSASSLGRIRRHRDQSTSESTSRGAHKTPSESQNQPKFPRSSQGPSKARHASSRRMRTRCHSMRRTGTVSGAKEAPARGTFTGGDAVKSLRRRASRRHQHRQAPVHNAPSAEVSIRGRAWTDAQRWPLEAVGYGSYFLLRSFNSDETLLKSFNSSSLKMDLGLEKPKRRYSGNDAPSIISGYAGGGGGPTTLRQCDQIFENEIANCRRTINPLTELIELPLHQLPSRVVEPSFEASFVSLLDNKLVSGFRKSDVSIDEAPPMQRRSYDDCLGVQIRATKELIKTLRRMQRQGLACGYSATMGRLVEKLTIEQLTGYGDDFSACDVDYLSALSLVEHIENNLSATSDDATKLMNETDSESLNAILSAKIRLLKQKHVDLKAIRDHYLRSHCGRRVGPMEDSGARQFSSQPLVAANRSKSESRLHGCLKALSSKDCGGATINSVNESGVPGSRKLSAPSKEAQLSCSTSTSSLADPRRMSRGQRERRHQHHHWTETTCGGGGPHLRQTNCKFGSLCPIEFVFNIEKQLAFKRAQGDRVIKLNQMTLDQLMSEKLELQKNLLRYEHWFARPTSRLEFSLVGHIYERYRAVKMIKSMRDQAVCIKSD